ncbi:zinc finger protein 62-like [Acyrthosiphon pisum]|uniref:C2H2-type domain-containing protein n=1 Tax=Acyrthosiphon pisum TaxID=7029 RepID=A0A8R2ACH5_ACYPI|nr:zinc finger protein 62-like [Acyrthosiphon pisum]|eukprot:XP_003245783.1 PREDICTED: zinc finger protein 62-like [Acyrthosiphon pisum]
MNCFNVERSPSVINSVRRLYVQFITSTSASSGHRGLHTRLLLQSVYDYKLMDQPNMNFNPYVHLTRLTKEEIKKYTLKNHKKKNTYKEDASTENSGDAIQHTQIQIKDEVEDPDVIEIKTEPEDQIIDITQGTTFSNYVEKDNGNKNICKICNATFDNFEETIVHKYLTHRSKLYICKVCNLQFVLEMHLYLHQAEHYNNPCMRNSSENPSEIQSYICRVCNVQFILGVHFYVHLAEHNHNPCMRNSSGNPSEIQSSSKSNLTINPSRNYKNSKSTSELAKKSCNTNTSVNLKQNVTNMITQSKIISSIKLDLDKKSNIGNVNSQRYVSPNIPNFNRNHKCKDCDKHFTTHRKLNIHQKEHEHQMICNKCHKKFVSKRNFEKHLLSHTNVVMSNGDSVSGKKIIKRTSVKKKKQNILPNKYSRKVKCNWCPKTITRCNMLRHIKNVHHHPNPINCIYCSMAFKDRASLRLHKSRIH